MVTAKLKAILKVLFADHVIMFTKRGDGAVEPHGVGQGDLVDMVSIAVELKRAHYRMLEMIEAAAAEVGELHLLSALKKSIEDIENGRDS